MRDDLLRSDSSSPRRSTSDTRAAANCASWNRLFPRRKGKEEEKANNSNSKQTVKTDRQKRRRVSLTDSSFRSNSREDGSSQFVLCPGSCGRHIAHFDLDRHLDQCLRPEESEALEDGGVYSTRSSCNLLMDRSIDCHRGNSDPEATCSLSVGLTTPSSSAIRQPAVSLSPTTSANALPLPLSRVSSSSNTCPYNPSSPPSSATQTPSAQELTSDASVAPARAAPLVLEQRYTISPQHSTGLLTAHIDRRLPEDAGTPSESVIVNEQEHNDSVRQYASTKQRAVGAESESRSNELSKTSLRSEATKHSKASAGPPFPSLACPSRPPKSHDDAGEPDRPGDCSEPGNRAASTLNRELSTNALQYLMTSSRQAHRGQRQILTWTISAASSTQVDSDDHSWQLPIRLEVPHNQGRQESVNLLLWQGSVRLRNKHDLCFPLFSSLPSTETSRHSASLNRSSDTNKSEVDLVLRIECQSEGTEPQDNRKLVLPPLDRSAPDHQFVRYHSRFSIGVLKSMLQKCVRRRRPLPAVRIAMELADRSLPELLRRLPIIMMEDSFLHPDLPLLIFWMIALSIPPSKSASDIHPNLDLHQPTLQKADFIRLFQVVYEISACRWKDPLLPSSVPLIDMSEAGNKHLSGSDAASAPASIPELLVWSLLVRAEYGGMKCDIEMLHRYASLWQGRFSRTARGSMSQGADESRIADESVTANRASSHNSPFEVYRPLRCESSARVQPLVQAGLQQLRFEDVPLEGVDFHCSPIVDALLADTEWSAMCQDILTLTSFSRDPEPQSLADTLRDCIWDHSSGVNHRLAWQEVCLRDGPPRQLPEKPNANLWRELVAPRVRAFQEQFIRDRLA
jgi:hypothetical protein